MPKQVTGWEAEKRWNERFPDKELLSFDGVTKPIRVRCPIHGEVEYKAYRDGLASKHGCPECAAQHTASVNSQAMKDNRAAEKKKVESNAKALGAFALWSSNEPLPEEDYVYVPFLKDVEFAAGAGAFNYEDYNGFRLPFAKATLWRQGVTPSNAICFAVRGDSMEPRFFDGGSIGVDMGDKSVKDGKIYAFMQEGELRVKLLYKEGKDKVRLVSYNPAYPEEVVHRKDIEMVGRVFWSSDLF